MKQHINFDVTDAQTKTDSDKIMSMLVDSSLNEITSGDGDSDDIVTTSFRGIDSRAFGYAFDGTNWDRLRSTSGALHVDIQDSSITVNESDTYAEDSAHTTADVGGFVLTVRQDTLAASTDADGDYAAFKTNSSGELYVTDEGVDALLTTIDSVLDSIKVDTGNIDTNITALTHDEDAVHSSGDKGIMPLAVRNDAGTALAADGDYIPFSTDSSGNLRVTTAGSNTEYAEDSAHTTGDTGTFSLAVRNDTKSALATTDGDYIPFQMNSVGELYVTDEDAEALLTTIDADTSTINTNIGNLTHLEDDAHTTADAGIQVLAVRQDTLANSTSADGDYGSLKLNGDGRLYVTAEITGTVDTDDDALADTSLVAQATNVDNTVGGTDLIATDLASRKYLYLFNNGNKKVYVGLTGVTTATGFPLPPGSMLDMRAGPSIDVYAISPDATPVQDIRTLELS